MIFVLGFVMLLFVSGPTFCALEGRQENILQKDMDDCRKRMLDDALETFISADSLQCTPGSNQDMDSTDALEYNVKRRKKNTEEKNTEEIIVHAISMFDMGPEIMLSEAIYRDAQYMIDSATPRGKLVNEHRRLHPSNCLCGVGVFEVNRVRFDYFFEPAGVFKHATFRTLYMRAEVQKTLDIMLKRMQTMQQSAFPGSRQHNNKLLLPPNFNKNLNNIKKLLENKKE